jgi:nitrate reductase beta subunit
MVWYIPPLSPVADVVHAAGYDADDPDQVFATIDALRIPVEYLANLFTAGDADTVRAVLRKLAAVRAMMRAAQLGLDPADDLPASVGASRSDLEDLYRLLAIAKYGDRYVIPPAHTEDAGLLMSQHEQLFCSLENDGGPGMGGTGPPAGSVESFHPARAAGPAGPPADSHLFRGDDGQVHFNLLGWDGNGRNPHLFPDGSTS